jgi:hypothetical protein
VTHETAYANHTATSELKVELAIAFFKVFIINIDKATFARKNRLNMISSAAVERVWKRSLAVTGTSLSDLQYKRGLSMAWNVVREDKFVIE